MKFIKIELNHTGKVYEYKTQLDLVVGGVYRIHRANGWVPPMRVKVIEISDTPSYLGNITEILAVSEEEEF